MIDFLQTYQNIIHYSLHFLAPGLIGYFFFKEFWKQAWVIMIATILIDLDHLLASPVFDSARCGIGFHPLHTVFAIIFYGVLVLIPNKYSKIIGAGLLFHILTDWFDCLLM